jgi:hypothetical protein
MNGAGLNGMMKKRFARLSEQEQRKVELEYHQMDPAEFDEFMSKAKKHTPNLVRLPATLVEALNAVADLEGERDYQTMVRRWIEERLRQEARLVLKLSKASLRTKKVPAILKRQTAK